MKNKKENTKILFIKQGYELWSPIGVIITKDEHKDINKIQEDSPHEIAKISSIYGDDELNKMIYDKFADDRIGGFWFRQTADMLKTIEMLCKK